MLELWFGVSTAKKNIKCLISKNSTFKIDRLGCLLETFE